MNQQARFRVGIVGTGHISHFHLQALRRLPIVEVVGLADVDRKRAEAVAAEFQVPAVVSSLDELLRLNPDVVHVLTPPASHAPLAIQALEGGCHVLVEKPLATSVEQCDAIAEAARQTGKWVCANHSNLRDRFFARALQRIEEGAIGEVISATYLRSSDYPPYQGGPLPPPYQDGGYPFRDVGVHALYMMQAILGEIEEVDSQFASQGSDPNLRYDEWSALVRCARGLGQIQMSWNIQPLQSRFLVQGTGGVLDADLFLMYVTVRRKRPLPRSINRIVDALSESAQVMSQVPWNLFQFARGRIRRYHGVQETVRAFYKRLSAGSGPPISIADAREVVYWTEKVARRADEAKRTADKPFAGPWSAPILVTGATGFIGRHLVQRLLDQGLRLRILARTPPTDDWAGHENVEVVLGDLGDPEAVDRAVEGTNLVYHLGAAMRGGSHEFERGTIIGTRNLVECCLRHQVARVVYVSSLSVLHATATGDARQVTEDWPLESHPERRGIYTLAKLRAEEIVTKAVHERGLPAVILRPGRVVGHGSPLVTAEVARQAAGRWLVIGHGNQPLPLIYVDDLIDAIEKVVEHRVFDGTILHLVDSTLITQNDVLNCWREQISGQARIVHLPVWLMHMVAAACVPLAALLRRTPPLSPYRLKSFLRALKFDCSSAERVLGWTPRVGIREGMVRAVRGVNAKNKEQCKQLQSAGSKSDSVSSVVANSEQVV